MMMQRAINLSIVGFIFAVHGCALNEAVKQTHPRAGFVITKPPMQISYRGDMTDASRAFTLDILRVIQDGNFTEFHFNENHNVRLNSIDAKSDSVQIILNETTDNKIGAKLEIDESIKKD